ncbi:g1418 [Coccomyxa elongata]
MEEDQQYERFDMDNDYEGGQWIGDEYFYTERKRKRRQTQEEHLYGYESEQSDEDKPRRGKGPRKTADYTKPVGFVSSGVVKSTEEKPEDIETAEHTGAGLGARNDLGAKQNGTGLGYPGHSISSGIGFRPAKEPQILDYDEDEGVVLPTSFGKSVKQAAEERLKEKKRREKEQKKAAAARPAGLAAAGTPGAPSVGEFERHTKGIGAKLLASMGYQEGQGLGRNKQGISKPIEVKLRPKGMGMGYNDYEEHKLIPDAKPAEEAPEKPKEEAVDVKLWRKRHAAARVKREFRTADEVLQEAAEKPAAAPRQTILDMRGPQARLVTNLEHLNVVDEAAAGDLVPMPELQHNLRLLVDLAEADIQRIDGKLRQEKDTAVILGREQRRLQEEVEVARRQVAQAAHVLQEVSRCQGADARLSLGDLARTYSELQSAYREEYVMYNLAAAALAQVMPRLTSLLAEWQPLEEPDRGLQYFSAWRPLLESDAQRDAIFQDVSPYASEDSYTRLLSAVVLPKLAGAITNSWEPRDPEPPLRFLEFWADLLPTGVQCHILDTLILPKLSRAVQSWEPVQERVPLHAWLHPWLEMLGPQLEDLYPPIRFKLATALQAWHPSDASALALLSPWHKVFDSKEWGALIGRSILPKLAHTLDMEFAVNPVAQDLAPWHWVMSWASVLPRPQLISLLEKHFFPKWHAVLQHWLAHNPDFDEVTAWYLGWKGMLPPEAQDHERIRAHLNSALNAMNSAVEGIPVQYAQPAPAAAAVGGYGYAGAAGAVPAAAGYAEQRAYDVNRAAEPSLRQLVENYAQEHGMEFLPKAGRRHEGLQVYGFGGVSCVIDASGGIVRAHIGGHWVPTGLEDLLNEARKRQRL